MLAANHILSNENLPLAPQVEIPATEMGCLEINLSNIVQNYRIMKDAAPTAEISAVLKADGYGFGAATVGKALQDEGCKTFFVAHLDEAIALRQALPHEKIYVLTGVLPETEDDLISHNLTPVLNHKGMWALWKTAAKKKTTPLPCALHIDSGIHRLGFEVQEILSLLSDPLTFEGLNLELVMSHLACSQIPGHPMNPQQLGLFQRLMPYFQSLKKSLADSGGLFLGTEYHYDMIRPGLGFFGMHPQSMQGANPFHNVLTLWGKVIQVRTVAQGETVGYGATFKTHRSTRLATLGLGFADGVSRDLSNLGSVYIGEFKAPIVGRISMDYSVVDVSDVPESLCYPGSWVQLVNHHQTLDHLAQSINTISRELSIHLGSRLYRVYK